MDRDALLRPIDARVDAMVAAGAAEEVRAAQAAGASATARKALGFDELLAGDVEAMKTRTRRYAQAPAHVAAQAAGRRARRRHRPRRRTTSRRELLEA